MIFLDLRDRYGITQVAINDDTVQWSDEAKVESFRSLAEDCKQEYVLQVEGIVVARPDDMINKDMLTGAIEVHPTAITILSKSKELPFSLGEDPKTSEANRYKHRYLDLRRTAVLDRMLLRSKMNNFTRNWFSKKDFLEVQTPIFSVSSPEGARDYLIPSRVNPGQFYALPQAPQQYKQLLMVGGIDKYFQIAPCFRDEDPRADRHSCEFYQIDCEMSFVEQQDVYDVVEHYIEDLVKELAPHKKISVQFKKLSFSQAIDLYGSDKPDLRFGMQLVEMTDMFTQSGFGVFK